MKKRIMVPLDGSTFGEHALPYAAAIARRTRAEVELVHVHVEHGPEAHLEGLTPYGYEHIEQYDYADEEKPARVEQRELDELAVRVTQTFGTPASATVLRGRIASALLQHAEQTGPELIVLATHARGGLRRIWLGSFGDELLRHARQPVLLIRPGEGAARLAAEPPLRRVLVPLDGSPFSERILLYAGDLIRRLGAPVTLLHLAAPLPDSVMQHPRTRDEHAAQLRTQAERYLEDATRRLARVLPIADRVVLLRRNASAAIAEYLAQRPFDLLAMTTHGRGGLSRLLMGSTADEVARTTHVPLLAFRPALTGAHASSVEPAFL